MELSFAYPPTGLGGGVVQAPLMVLI